MSADSRECYRLGAGAGARRAVCCAASGAVLLWDRTGLLLYAGGRLRERPLTMVADFSIRQVLISNSCAVCVDRNGVAHTMPLKFKANVDATVKIPFRPRAQGLLACAQVDRDTAAAISRAEDLLLTIHRVNADFNTISKYKIEIDLEKYLSDDYHSKLIMHASKENLKKDVAEKVFHSEKDSCNEKPTLVLFSFDRLTLFGQVLDAKVGSNTVSPSKLFTCPTEISELQVVNTNGLQILLGLKSGAVVILSCNAEKLEARTVYLNAAIHRMLVYEDQLIYSDGVKMWKAEHIFSDKGITFIQMFVTQPKDFIKYNDRILCTTYTNLLYSFCMESNDSPVNETTPSDGFVPVPRDLTTSKEIVAEIMNEVKRNEVILQNIRTENTLMTAVALSRERSVLDRHIGVTTHIFDKYEDALEEPGIITLTKPLKEYFEPGTVLLQVKLQTSSEFRQKFIEICSCLSNNIKLHAAVVRGGGREETTVPLDSTARGGLRCLLPVQLHDHCSKLAVTLKIISPISGPMDSTQIFWSVLFSKQVTLNSENFIKVDSDSFNNKVVGCQNLGKDLNEIVSEIAKINHGLLYDFHVPPKKNCSKEWSCYLKLPKDYQQRFSNIDYYANTLNSKISKFLVNKFGGDFLKGKQTVYLRVSGTRSALQILMEEGNVLRISGYNADIVFDLRQYFSGLFYTNGHLELIPQIHYTRVENLRRKLSELQRGGAPEAGVLEVARQFHRHTLGALPL